MDRRSLTKKEQKILKYLRIQAHDFNKPIDENSFYRIVSIVLAIRPGLFDICEGDSFLFEQDIKRNCASLIEKGYVTRSESSHEIRITNVIPLYKF